MFKIGDYVRIRPEWCDSPEEAKIIHIVVNVNEVTKRCTIEAQGTGMHLAPTMVVSFEMIEKVDIFTAYAPEADITFIMCDTYNGDEVKTTECIGWHYGEPGVNRMEDFFNDLKAEY